MLDWAVWFKDFPPEIATIIVAMMPVAELRGAIPLAIGVWNLSPWISYFLALFGNMIPVVLILALVGPVSRFLGERSKFFKKFFDWIFEKTKRENQDKIKRWGVMALFLLVAIPLPLTGAWTGSLAAFVFRIPFKQSFPTIFAGTAVAGLIVVFLSWGFLI